MMLYDYFYEIINIVLLVINLITFFYISSSGELSLVRYQESNNFFTYLGVIILSLFIGFRPGTTIFGDTALYINIYNSINENEMYVDEPLFRLLNWVFFNLGCSVEIFFSFIAFLYILLPILYCRRFITRYNLWICFIIFVSSFSFLGYGVNGIRNGLATSILIYALSFLLDGSRKYLIYYFLLSLCAILIHKTTVLPFIVSILSFYVVRDINTGIKIWVISIPVSLLLGSFLSNYIAKLGFFDDRLTSYLGNVPTAMQKGFRWDFLLYSMMPILLAYYVRNYVVSGDRKYSILMNTYIISNAFWIIVINANFSNRFAYLSWFLYPITILYPIFCYKIWKNHNVISALIFLLYFSFTFLMWLRG